MEVGGICEKGVERIQVIEKVPVHYMEEVRQEEDLCEKNGVIDVGLTKKGGKIGRVGMEVVPYSLFGINLMFSLTEITSCEYIKKGVGGYRERRSRYSRYSRYSRWNRMWRVETNLEKTLTKFGMNATLGITDENDAELAGIRMKNRLEGKLGGFC